MESKTNYTIVGIIVLLLSAGLLSVSLWLSVGFNQKSYTQYTVYLHEAAAGLAPDAPVKYNGVQVGFVKKIALNKNDPRQVELTLDVEEGTPITTSTSATLISQGITGVAYLGLSASTSELTPIQKMPGEPYPVIPAMPSLFNQLDTVLKEVAESVKKVSTKVQKVFNAENTLHVKQLLANMAKASKDLPQLIKEFKTGIKRFNTLAVDMGEASRSVTKTMGAGKNTLNSISQQALPSAVILLHRLNRISTNLEQVSKQLRQNPSVVIRGTKPPKPGPGE